MIANLVNRVGQVPTPYYLYDLNVLQRNIDHCKKEASKYNYHVHYAIKANSNRPILSKMLNAGFGSDCVSGYEIQRSLEVGFKPEQIAFAGVGKADWEIELGIDRGIFSFNVESIEELRVIAQIAAAKNKTANISLRLNPNVDPQTHKYITTGLEENKFGINPWDYDQILDFLKDSPQLILEGLHFHIGSQITNLNPFKKLCIRVNEIQEYFKQQGVVVKHINVGGGLGINYQAPDMEAVPDFAEYFKVFNAFLELEKGQQLHFEIGRALVGQCGSIISKTLFVKKGIKTDFIILDAGMTELIRPALYHSFHVIEKVAGGEADHKYDVVGPICESSDLFGKAVSLPEVQRNELIAIRSTGAYAECMASNYNLRPFINSYYV